MFPRLFILDRRRKIIPHFNSWPFTDISSWGEDDNFKKIERRNPIWDYFLRHIKGGKAKCIKCARILSNIGGNTASMRNHMQMVHKIKVMTKSTYEFEETFANEECGNSNYDRSTGDGLDYFRDKENYVAGTENDCFKKNDSANRGPNPIWDYFLRHVNGERAKCIKCDRTVSIKGGCTGMMRAHMRLVHKIQVDHSQWYVNSHTP